MYRVSQDCPPEKKESMGKCDNLNFREKKALIEKRHPKLDQSELNTIKVG
jgi:hypothetical protein